MARIKKVGAPIGNNNAEIWSIESATELFDKAIELSKSSDYDFIGEVAKDLDTTRFTFRYLSEKYPTLKRKLEVVFSNCEANCFANGKKGNITPSLSIMNLKSNHGWTDRAETTTQTVNYDGGKVDEDKVKEILKKIDEKY